MKFSFGVWLFLTGSIVVLGCAATPGRRCNDNFNSTLWVRTAAEYKAGSIQTYNTALRTIDTAIADRSWTAVPEQAGECASLPVAVVMDVDETVLDTAAYEAGLVLDGAAFDPASWDRWIALKRASAVPGAVGFINALQGLNVTVIYITNRACRPRPGDPAACPQEQDTIDNLARVGIRGVSPANMMLKDEQPGWSSEKRSRRAAVAEKYRVVMLFGDDLGDFLPGVKQDITPARRDARVRAHAGHWDRKWFILSNPIYGSWLRVLANPKAQYLQGE